MVFKGGSFSLQIFGVQKSIYFSPRERGPFSTDFLALNLELSLFGSICGYLSSERGRFSLNVYSPNVDFSLLYFLVFQREPFSTELWSPDLRLSLQNFSLQTRTFLYKTLLSKRGPFSIQFYSPNLDISLFKTVELSKQNFILQTWIFIYRISFSRCGPFTNLALAHLGGSFLRNFSLPNFCYKTLAKFLFDTVVSLFCSPNMGRFRIVS